MAPRNQTTSVVIGGGQNVQRMYIRNVNKFNTHNDEQYSCFNVYLIQMKYTADFLIVQNHDCLFNSTTVTVHS